MRNNRRMLASHENLLIDIVTLHLNKKIKQEVNANREAHGKKPFDDDGEPPKSSGRKRDNTSKKKLARRKKAGFKNGDEKAPPTQSAAWL